MWMLVLPALFAFAEPPAFRGRSAVEWARDLKSDSRADRLKALLALRELADRWPAAVEAAAPMLADSDPVVRRIAADLQGRHASMNAAAAVRLARVLDDPQAEVRLAAAYALGGARPHAAAVVGPLGARISDEDGRVRRAVAGVLAGYGQAAEPAVEALVEALGDADGETRASAIEALRNIGPAARAGAEALRGIVRAGGNEADAAEEALNRILGRRRVLVIIDASGSMECVREFAKAQTLRALNDLEPHHRFNVFACRNDGVYGLSTSFLRGEPDLLARSAGLLDDIPFNGRTNVEPGLVRAIDSEPDEIVLISDGEFTDDQTADLRRRNTVCGERPIVVRAIALKSKFDADLSAMRRLAAGDAGSLTIVDLTFLEHRR